MPFFSSPSSPASVKSHSHASSYFSMHQLGFDLVPKKESYCISRFSHWLENLQVSPLDGSTISWVISQRSGQDPQARPHWLTLSLDSTLKVTKHFCQTLPAEVLIAVSFNPDKFCSVVFSCCELPFTNLFILLIPAAWILSWYMLFY